jgi:DNA polymerase-3 subunit delta'
MSKESKPAPQITTPLPWHVPLIKQLEAAQAQQRLPHALLIHGGEGIGKRLFAQWLARALMCDVKGSQLAPCGTCASCALTTAVTHPDFTTVSPDEGKQQISIEQIRDLSERLSMTSYRRGFKIAIVEPAHQLTTGAANSLLKTLEEPTRDSLLILISSRLSAVLATIRSRCQKLAMPPPSIEAALEWLRSTSGQDVPQELAQFAGAAPLKALAYLDGSFATLNDQMTKSLSDFLAQRSDVTQVASQWADDALNDRLDWLDGWISLRLRAGILGTDDPVTLAVLPTQARTLNISAWYSLLDRVRALKAQLTRTALQRELALEALLIGFADTWNASSQ